MNDKNTEDTNYDEEFNKITESFKNNDDNKDDGSTSVTQLKDSYFDDDENFENDTVILDEMDAGIVSQDEGTISWKVKNFYDENGEQLSKRTLRNNPPILQIKNNNNDNVEFLITKDLALQFETLFGDIYKGYFGVIASKDRSASTQLKKSGQNIKKFVQDKPVQSVIYAVIIILLLVAALF